MAINHEMPFPLYLQPFKHNYYQTNAIIFHFMDQLEWIVDKKNYVKILPELFPVD